MHDDLCPTDQNLDPACWFCDLIAKVRADEREQCQRSAASAVASARPLPGYPTLPVLSLAVDDPHRLGWTPISVELVADLVAQLNDSRIARAGLRAKVEALRDVLKRRTALHKGEPYMLPEPAHTYDERTIRAVLALFDGDVT